MWKCVSSALAILFEEAMTQKAAQVLDLKASALIYKCLKGICVLQSLPWSHLSVEPHLNALNFHKGS